MPRILMHASLWMLLLAGTPMILAPRVVAQVPTQPATGFVDPIVRIGVGRPDGSAEVEFQSARSQASAPRLEDFALPQPAATVKFSPLPGSENTPSKNWRYRIDVAGLVPVTATQQRYGKVTYADQTTETFAYVVSNQAANAFSWTIAKPPNPWAASDFSAGSPTCTSFFVTPKDSVATGVRVMAALVEQSTNAAITSDKLRLCKGTAECKGDEQIDLPPNVPSQLMLCTTKSFHGNFTGSINLIAREKPEGEAILQKGEFSSFGAKLLGFAVIFIGVYFAWLAKVYARARLERDQALLPAIEMRSQLESLQGELEKVKPEYAQLCVNVRSLIASVLKELAKDTLDRLQLIPPKLPNPFGGARDNGAAYKEYLESRNPKIQLISTLIKSGIVAAVAKDTGTPQSQEQVTNAVQSIDAIASVSPLPTSAIALSQIQTILSLIHLTSPSVESESVMTAAQELKVVTLEIETISKGIWTLYALLTALAGLVVLILSNQGFGTPLDYVFAFFWGFALPVSVQSLSPGSVATALNISIAKA